MTPTLLGFPQTASLISTWVLACTHAEVVCIKAIHHNALEVDAVQKAVKRGEGEGNVHAILFLSKQIYLGGRGEHLVLFAAPAVVSLQ